MPACRPSRRQALCDTADGHAAHYAFLVRWYTTTSLSPDQIHEIGRTEMAKNRAQMETRIQAQKRGVQGRTWKAFLHPRYEDCSPVQKPDRT